MSLSVVRYIELISVLQRNSTYYLHLIVHLDQAVELYMEIDSYTAESLQQECSFDNDYKYRLSLRAIEDVFSNRIYSTISKTLLTQSERFDFNISPLYKQHITRIKNTVSIEQLLDLPFVKAEIEETATEPEAMHSVSEQQTNENLLPIAIETIEEVEQTVAEQTPVAEVLETNLLHEQQTENEASVEVVELEKVSQNSAFIALDNDEKKDIELEALQTKQEVTHANTPPPTEPIIVQLEETIIDEEKPLPVTETPVQEGLLTTRTNATKPKQPRSYSKRLLFAAVLTAVLSLVFVFIYIFPFEKQPADEVPVATTASSPTSTKQFYDLEDSFTFDLPAQYAAITFTKGPSTYSEQIVDILEKHQVGATFFFIGKHVSGHSEQVRMIAEKGYAIGHATENYTLLTTMPQEQQLFAWEATLQKIENISGKTVSLFRPPYGLFNSDTQMLVKENNIKAVTWTIDPYDVKAQTAPQIVQYIEKQKLKGSIINLAESKATVEALPEIIKLLQQQNLKIVMLQ